MRHSTAILALAGLALATEQHTLTKQTTITITTCNNVCTGGIEAPPTSTEAVTPTLSTTTIQIETVPTIPATPIIGRPIPDDDEATTTVHLEVPSTTLTTPTPVYTNVTTTPTDVGTITKSTSLITVVTPSGGASVTPSTTPLVPVGAGELVKPGMMLAIFGGLVALFA